MTVGLVLERYGSISGHYGIEVPTIHQPSLDQQEATPEGVASKGRK